MMERDRKTEAERTADGRERGGWVINGFLKKRDRQGMEGKERRMEGVEEVCIHGLARSLLR